MTEDREELIQAFYAEYREKYGEEMSDIAKEHVREGLAETAGMFPPEEHLDMMRRAIEKSKQSRPEDDEQEEQLSEEDRSAAFFADVEGEQQELFFRIADYLRRTYRADIHDQFGLATSIGVELRDADEKFENGAKSAIVRVVLDPPYDSIMHQTVELELKPDGTFEDVTGADDEPEKKTGCAAVLGLLLVTLAWMVLRSW